MHRFTILLSLAASALVTLSPSSRAIDFTTLDYPGSGLTELIGIDGNTIVGWWDEPSPFNGQPRGLIYDGTNFTSVSGPASSNYSLKFTGIAGGTIFGYYSNTQFTYTNGTFTPLPSAITSIPSALVAGISGNTIVGTYETSANPSSQYAGFVFDGTSFQTLNDPLGVHGTEILGISGGMMFGDYFGADFSGGANVRHGFTYDGSNFTTIDYPLAKGSIHGSVTGVSGNLVVGNYGRGEGFVYDGTNFTTISYPGALETFITGISGNTFVGYYQDSSGVHGFVATVPEPSAFALVACGGLALAAAGCRRRRGRTQLLPPSGS